MPKRPKKRKFEGHARVRFVCPGDFLRELVAYLRRFPDDKHVIDLGGPNGPFECVPSQDTEVIPTLLAAADRVDGLPFADPHSNN